MESIYSYIGTYVAGVISSHLWEKFIHRLTILRFTVSSVPIGISAENPAFGKVEIKHNNQSVNNLYFTTVRILNETSRDISNIEIEIGCDSQGVILVSQAMNLTSTKYIYFTDKYSKMLTDSKPDDSLSVLRFRDYSIPVLNRGHIIEVSMLIDSVVRTQPVITVGCDHLGVKMKFQKEPPQKLLGESQSLGSLFGFMITAVVCYLIIRSEMNLTPAVWYSFFLGGLSAGVGIFLIKIFKFFRRVLT